MRQYLWDIRPCESEIGEKLQVGRPLFGAHVGKVVRLTGMAFERLVEGS